ncbi:MAG: helix-hairpin-helix domain-containing protein [Chloroflexota bacterium]
MAIRGILAAGLVIVGVLIGVGVMELREASRSEPVIINTAVPTATTEATTMPGPTSTPQPIQVFVNGAVNVPDVYILPPDSRVKQVIEAAGGFSDGANTAVINLALPLVDGMQIYVPEMIESTEIPQQIITQPTIPARAGAGGLLLVDINAADLNELDTLPGIGPVTAQKIIDYREEHGGFADIEAILDVSGIGEVTFEEIRELITAGN